MEFIILIISIIITIIIILSSLIYWESKYKKKSVDIAFTKYQKYLKNKYVCFCYNDNEFLFVKQPNQTLLIKNDTIIYKNNVIKINEIKEVKYQYYQKFKISINLFSKLKIYLYLKSGEVKEIIPPANIEIYYQYAFILLIDMLINNYENSSYDLYKRILQL